MLLNVSECWQELLLAFMVIILSIWYWRREHLQQTTNSVNCIDANGRSAHKTERPLHPDHHNPTQASVTVPDGYHVVVSADNDSTVNLPMLSKNSFYGTSFFNFPTTSGNDSSIQTDSSVLQKFLENHKANMKRKTECIFEGKKDVKYKTLLKNVYTQLFVTQGELNKVNNEHEILKIMKDKAFRVQHCQETVINCNEIFSQTCKDEVHIKTVLTKGIAGIGKTVSVQKFILDWSDGEANQNIDCIFLLPFREMNLIKDMEYSLHELLQEFHPELEQLKETRTYENLKLAFIFDGLDESRLLLDFSGRMVTSIKKKVTMDLLITNLIKGNLLPSALIWITSRPAAANQIPSEFVSLFTEVRGFTDKQKEEYFRKRILDETEASKIISHVKVSRSLYIMCHIPVFCWITATVLHTLLLQSQGEVIPSTLTEMYIHFLLIQMNMKNQKYDVKIERDLTKLMESNKELILNLAKLAFEQLKKGNIMFYESDLRECGINVNEASEYTGLCAEIFKQESVLHEKKVYCFIHLTLQEFLAAFHIFCAYLHKNMDELQFFFNYDPPKKVQLDHLLKNAIDKAKESENGHLDLFLRFLLGISLESNQDLLTGLLPNMEKTQKSIGKVIQHIRQMQNKDLSPEKSINHLFCLLELKDSSLYNQVRKYLNIDALPERELSLSNCSALAYMLLMSEEVLDELDPKKYNTSNKACRRLVPAMRCCKKALFAGCELTESCCECVAAALQSENCPLRELDLSDNYRLESAAKLLSDGLRSSLCKLEVLRLVRCNFSPSSCAELVCALISISSSLKELDLSSNDLQDSGLHQLLLGLGNSNGKLQILRLSWCNLTEISCESLSSYLTTGSGSYLTQLDLHDNNLQNAGVRLLCAELENPKCKLEILRLSGCMITEEGCSSLALALKSNPSHLRELDLRYNHPGELGEKLLATRLEDPLCKFYIRMDPRGEHFIKAGAKKYGCMLTLDSNTAHKHLHLSESNRKVTFSTEDQDYPDHEERFEMFPQVLCKKGLSDRCYWEVDFEDSKPEIAVTYSQIQRKELGLDLHDALAQFGLNEVSWSLGFSHIGFQVCHNSVYTDITAAVSRSGKIAVYLDWPSGILSFYNISVDTQTLSHIHTFKTTFKSPLFPGFSVEFGSVSLCPME